MKTQRNILIAFLLNLGFSIFELLGGIVTGSVAIISDALHDFGDAISIGVSFFLERKSQQKPDASHSYGYSRYSVLGAAITNLILLFGSCVVVYNAVMRIVHPVQLHSDGMILMAVLGAAMNLAAAWFTHGGESLNEKAVNLHMLEDVLGWAIVLIGAVVMRFTDWWFLDPALSLALAVFIGFHALKNLKAVGDVFLEKTPEGIDPEEIIHHLEELPGVESIHHLHIWSTDGYRHSATLHAVVTGEYGPAKRAIKEELHEHGITHSTVELESPGEHCEDTCCQPATHTHHHHHCH